MSASIHAVEERLRLNPDDELSWQVYGDWLQQRGDPRGELIALEQSWPDEEVAQRIEALAAEQVVALADISAVTELTWRHGFIVAVEERSLEFPSDVAALARLLADPRTPLLARVSLGFERWSSDDMSATDYDVMNEDRLDTLPALAELDLREVRSLRVAYGEAGDEVAELLAGMSGLGLRELDLRYSQLSDAGAQALARCEGLRELRLLRLHANRISSDGVQALARSSVFTQLELLDLRGNPVGPTGARALANSAIVRKLGVLRLDPEDINVTGIEALAQSTQLPRDLARLWRGRATLDVDWR